MEAVSSISDPLEPSACSTANHHPVAYTAVRGQGHTYIQVLDPSVPCACAPKEETMHRHAVTPDRSLEVVLSQAPHLHPDAGSKSKTSGGVSGPDVTVTEVISQPPSPTGKLAEPEPFTRAAPATFPYFPLLPAELRLKIW
jgi:hypothetical protein